MLVKTAVKTKHGEALSWNQLSEDMRTTPPVGNLRPNCSQMLTPNVSLLITMCFIIFFYIQYTYSLLFYSMLSYL